MSQTIALYRETESEVSFQVYYGTTNQETVYVSRKTYDALCKQNNCKRLASYNDLRGTRQPVLRGEKSIKVAAYTKKAYNCTCPISGEDSTEYHRSPRTLSLFARN